MTRSGAVLMVIAVILVVSAMIVTGCSCGEKPAASTSEGGGESSRHSNPAWNFRVFKEVRNELSPETYTVGQLIEYRTHLVPMGDLNAVSHLWIDAMRAWQDVDTTIPYPHIRLKHPNFSINGLVYQIWYSIHSECDDRGRAPGLVGTEFISAASRVRQNTVWVNLPSNNPNLARGGYIDNLILDNQSDTVTLTIRFSKPGRYTIYSEIRSPIQEWQGQDHLEVTGCNRIEHGRTFIVEER